MSESALTSLSLPTSLAFSIESHKAVPRAMILSVSAVLKVTVCPLTRISKDRTVKGADSGAVRDSRLSNSFCKFLNSFSISLDFYAGVSGASSHAVIPASMNTLTPNLKMQCIADKLIIRGAFASHMMNLTIT